MYAIAMKSIILASLLAAVPAAAAPHSLVAKVWHRKTSYVKSVKIVEGKIETFLGFVDSSDGETRREMILNLVLDRAAGKSGGFDLNYQIELSKGPRRPGPIVNVQGVLAMRSGDRLVLLQCGDWAVRFDLDRRASRKKGKAKSKPALANYRLTLDLARGKSKVKCQHVVKLGSQGNVVTGGKSGDRKYGLKFDTRLMKKKEGLSLEWHLSHTPFGEGGTLTLQKESAMKVGKKVSYNTKEYRMSFLIDKP